MITRQYYFGNLQVYDILETLAHITEWGEANPDEITEDLLSVIQTGLIDLRYVPTIDEDTMFWEPITKMFMVISQWMRTWGKTVDESDILTVLDDGSMETVPDRVVIDLTNNTENATIDDRWVNMRGNSIGAPFPHDELYADAIQDAIEEEILLDINYDSDNWWEYSQ